MSASEEQTLLAELDADDWFTIQEAVEAAGDWLRLRRIATPLKSEIAARLLRLSSHPKWEVRKAVAHALLFLRHDVFHAAIAHMVADENSWVRDAARKTLQRRSELTRSDIQGEEHSDAILDLLSELEGRHGIRARRSALKIADHLHLRFVRGVYHEIVRVIAPLDASLINMGRELDGNPTIPVSTLSHIRRARDRVKLLTEMLDSLRDFATEATGDFTTEPILPILKEAAELALEALDPPAGGIVVHYDVEASLTLEANRFRLVQALINVMANAIEACADLTCPGELHIAGRQQSDAHAMILIADNGCGMNEEALRDCIQLYSSGKPGGMGFGLPLAKKIIELDHQGTLSIDSRQGEGTTVSIILPLEQNRAEG